MKSQAALRLRKPEPEKVSIITINGKRFQCSCGANVFVERPKKIFVCNACGEQYQGVR